MKKLKDSDLNKLLTSERADGLIILNPEDAEAIKLTVASLRYYETAKPEKSAKKAAKKTKK